MPPPTRHVSLLHLHLDGDKLPLAAFSAAEGNPLGVELPGPLEPPGTLDFEITVPVATPFSDLLRIFDETHPPRVDVELQFPRVPSTHRPLARVTGSGRRIYGSAPALGSAFYTVGGKLERRRVRSRLAALARKFPPTPSFKLESATITASEVRRVAGRVSVDCVMTSIPGITRWTRPAPTLTSGTGGSR